MLPRGARLIDVDVQSPGFRTELRLLELGGSEVTDRGTHLVVRTPGNPTFYWGNFLLLPAAPEDAAAVAWWTAEHRREFDAAHVSLGIDGVDVPDPLREAGFVVDTVVTLTCEEVRRPPHPDTHSELRLLAGDRDWRGQVDLTLADEDDDPHLTRDFVQRRTDDHRALVEGGHGRWWGGFVGGQLVSSLGIFATGDGLARYQSVKTRADHRGRGLCGTLVHRAGLDALQTLGADRLVMCADPGYAAIRIYRSVGFTDAASHTEATLRPPAP